MNNKNITTLTLMAICVAFVAGTVASSPLAITGVGDSILFKGGSYCVCKNSLECNVNTPGADCNNNLITNYGKNVTREYLSLDGTYEAFDVLALSNGSAPTANDFNFTVEMAGGLARAAATVGNNPTTGNWSLYHLWTADGTFMNVNTTGIFNDTTAGTGPMLAGGTFTAVNLESSDTLAINYTLWIS